MSSAIKSSTTTTKTNASSSIRHRKRRDEEHGKQMENIKNLKVQKRVSKLHIPSQMSTIVEESYNPNKHIKKINNVNANLLKNALKGIATVSLSGNGSTLSETTSNRSASANTTDPSRTSHDVDSLTLCSSKNAFPLPPASNAKKDKSNKSSSSVDLTENEMQKRKRKQINSHVSRKVDESVKRSYSNSDIHGNNFIVYPIHVDIPKFSIIRNQKRKNYEDVAAKLSSSKKKHLKKGKERLSDSSDERMIKQPSIISCILSEILNDDKFPKAARDEKNVKKAEDKRASSPKSTKGKHVDDKHLDLDKNVGKHQEKIKSKEKEHDSRRILYKKDKEKEKHKVDLGKDRTRENKKDWRDKVEVEAGGDEKGKSPHRKSKSKSRIPEPIKTAGSAEKRRRESNESGTHLVDIKKQIKSKERNEKSRSGFIKMKKSFLNLGIHSSKQKCEKNRSKTKIPLSSVNVARKVESFMKQPSNDSSKFSVFVTRSNNMQRFLEEDHASIDNVCSCDSRLLKTTLTRSDLGNLNIPDFSSLRTSKEQTNCETQRTEFTMDMCKSSLLIIESKTSLRKCDKTMTKTMAKSPSKLSAKFQEDIYTNIMRNANSNYDDVNYSIDSMLLMEKRSSVANPMDANQIQLPGDSLLFSPSPQVNNNNNTVLPIHEYLIDQSSSDNNQNRMSNEEVDEMLRKIKGKKLGRRTSSLKALIDSNCLKPLLDHYPNLINESKHLLTLGTLLKRHIKNKGTNTDLVWTQEDIKLFKFYYKNMLKAKTKIPQFSQKLWKHKPLKVSSKRRVHYMNAYDAINIANDSDDNTVKSTKIPVYRTHRSRVHVPGKKKSRHSKMAKIARECSNSSDATSNSVQPSLPHDDEKLSKTQPAKCNNQLKDKTNVIDMEEDEFKQLDEPFDESAVLSDKHSWRNIDEETFDCAFDSDPVVDVSKCEDKAAKKTDTRNWLNNFPPKGKGSENSMDIRDSYNRMMHRENPLLYQMNLPPNGNLLDVQEKQSKISVLSIKHSETLFHSVSMQVLMPNCRVNGGGAQTTTTGPRKPFTKSRLPVPVKRSSHSSTRPFTRSREVIATSSLQENFTFPIEIDLNALKGGASSSNVRGEGTNAAESTNNISDSRQNISSISDHGDVPTIPPPDSIKSQQQLVANQRPFHCFLCQLCGCCMKRTISINELNEHSLSTITVQLFMDDFIELFCYPSPDLIDGLYRNMIIQAMQEEAATNEQSKIESPSQDLLDPTTTTQSPEEHVEEDFPGRLTLIRSLSSLERSLIIATPMMHAIGLTFYTFKSVLRQYLFDREVLQMLTPCVKGLMQKAPQRDESLLVDPEPALQRVKSRDCLPLLVTYETAIPEDKERAIDIEITPEIVEEGIIIPHTPSLRHIDFTVAKPHHYEIRLYEEEEEKPVPPPKAVSEEKLIEVLDYHPSEIVLSIRSTPSVKSLKIETMGDIPPEASQPFRDSLCKCSAPYIGESADDFTVALESHSNHDELVISFRDMDVYLLLSGGMFSPCNECTACTPCHDACKSPWSRKLFSELFESLKHNSPFAQKIHHILQYAAENVDNALAIEEARDSIGDILDSFAMSEGRHILDTRIIIENDKTSVVQLVQTYANCMTKRCICGAHRGRIKKKSKTHSLLRKDDLSEKQIVSEYCQGDFQKECDKLYEKRDKKDSRIFTTLKEYYSLVNFLPPEQQHIVFRVDDAVYVYERHPPILWVLAKRLWREHRKRKRVKGKFKAKTSNASCICDLSSRSYTKKSKNASRRMKDDPSERSTHRKELIRVMKSDSSRKEPIGVEKTGNVESLKKTCECCVEEDDASISSTNSSNVKSVGQSVDEQSGGGSVVSTPSGAESVDEQPPPDENSAEPSFAESTEEESSTSENEYQCRPLSQYFTMRSKMKKNTCNEKETYPEVVVILKNDRTCTCGKSSEERSLSTSEEQTTKDAGVQNLDFNKDETTSYTTSSELACSTLLSPKSFSSDTESYAFPIQQTSLQSCLNNPNYYCGDSDSSESKQEAVSAPVVGSVPIVSSVIIQPALFVQNHFTISNTIHNNFMRRHSSVARIFSLFKIKNIFKDYKGCKPAHDVECSCTPAHRDCQKKVLEVPRNSVMQGEKGVINRNYTEDDIMSVIRRLSENVPSTEKPLIEPAKTCAPCKPCAIKAATKMDKLKTRVTENGIPASLKSRKTRAKDVPNVPMCSCKQNKPNITIVDPTKDDLQLLAKGTPCNCKVNRASKTQPDCMKNEKCLKTKAKSATTNESPAEKAFNSIGINVDIEKPSRAVGTDPQEREIAKKSNVFKDPYIDSEESVTDKIEESEITIREKLLEAAIPENTSQWSKICRTCCKLDDKEDVKANQGDISSLYPFRDEENTIVSSVTNTSRDEDNQTLTSVPSGIRDEDNQTLTSAPSEIRDEDNQTLTSAASTETITGKKGKTVGISLVTVSEEKEEDNRELSTELMNPKEETPAGLSYDAFNDGKEEGNSREKSIGTFKIKREGHVGVLVDKFSDENRVEDHRAPITETIKYRKEEAVAVENDEVSCSGSTCKYNCTDKISILKLEKEEYRPYIEPDSARQLWLRKIRSKHDTTAKKVPTKTVRACKECSNNGQAKDGKSGFSGSFRGKSVEIIIIPDGMESSSSKGISELKTDRSRSTKDISEENVQQNLSAKLNEDASESEKNTNRASTSISISNDPETAVEKQYDKETENENNISLSNKSIAEQNATSNSTSKNSVSEKNIQQMFVAKLYENQNERIPIPDKGTVDNLKECAKQFDLKAIKANQACNECCENLNARICLEHKEEASEETSEGTIPLPDNNIYDIYSDATTPDPTSNNISDLKMLSHSEDRSIIKTQSITETKYCCFMKRKIREVYYTNAEGNDRVPMKKPDLELKSKDLIESGSALIIDLDDSKAIKSGKEDKKRKHFENEDKKDKKLKKPLIGNNDSSTKSIQNKIGNKKALQQKQSTVSNTAVIQRKDKISPITKKNANGVKPATTIIVKTSQKNRSENVKAAGNQQKENATKEIQKKNIPERVSLTKTILKTNLSGKRIDAAIKKEVSIYKICKPANVEPALQMIDFPNDSEPKNESVAPALIEVTRKDSEKTMSEKTPQKPIVTNKTSHFSLLSKAAAAKSFKTPILPSQEDVIDIHNEKSEFLVVNKSTPQASEMVRNGDVSVKVSSSCGCGDQKKEMLSKSNNTATNIKTLNVETENVKSVNKNEKICQNCKCKYEHNEMLDDVLENICENCKCKDENKTSSKRKLFLEVTETVNNDNAMGKSSTRKKQLSEVTENVKNDGAIEKVYQSKSELEIKKILKDFNKTPTPSNHPASNYNLVDERLKSRAKVNIERGILMKTASTQSDRNFLRNVEVTLRKYSKMLRIKTLNEEKPTLIDKLVRSTLSGKLSKRTSAECACQSSDLSLTSSSSSPQYATTSSHNESANNKSKAQRQRQQQRNDANNTQQMNPANAYETNLDEKFAPDAASTPLKRISVLSANVPRCKRGSLTAFDCQKGRAAGCKKKDKAKEAILPLTKVSTFNVDSGNENASALTGNETKSGAPTVIRQKPLNLPNVLAKEEDKSNNSDTPKEKKPTKEIRLTPPANTTKVPVKEEDRKSNNFNKLKEQPLIPTDFDAQAPVDLQDYQPSENDQYRERLADQRRASSHIEKEISDDDDDTIRQFNQLMRDGYRTSMVHMSATRIRQPLPFISEPMLDNEIVSMVSDKSAKGKISFNQFVIAKALTEEPLQTTTKKDRVHNKSFFCYEKLHGAQKADPCKCFAIDSKGCLQEPTTPSDETPPTRKSCSCAAKRNKLNEDDDDIGTPFGLDDSDAFPLTKNKFYNMMAKYCRGMPMSLFRREKPPQRCSKGSVVTNQFKMGQLKRIADTDFMSYRVSRKKKRHVSMATDLNIEFPNDQNRHGRRRHVSETTETEAPNTSSNLQDSEVQTATKDDDDATTPKTESCTQTTPKTTNLRNILLMQKQIDWLKEKFCKKEAEPAPCAPQGCSCDKEASPGPCECKSKRAPETQDINIALLNAALDSNRGTASKLNYIADSEFIAYVMKKNREKRHISVPADEEVISEWSSDETKRRRKADPKPTTSSPITGTSSNATDQETNIASTEDESKKRRKSDPRSSNASGQDASNEDESKKRRNSDPKATNGRSSNASAQDASNEDETKKRRKSDPKATNGRSSTASGQDASNEDETKKRRKSDPKATNGRSSNATSPDTNFESKEEESKTRRKSDPNAATSKSSNATSQDTNVESKEEETKTRRKSDPKATTSRGSNATSQDTNVPTTNEDDGTCTQRTVKSTYLRKMLLMQKQIDWLKKKFCKNDADAAQPCAPQSCTCDKDAPPGPCECKSKRAQETQNINMALFSLRQPTMYSNSGKAPGHMEIDKETGIVVGEYDDRLLVLKKSVQSFKSQSISNRLSTICERTEEPNSTYRDDRCVRRLRCMESLSRHPYNHRQVRTRSLSPIDVRNELFRESREVSLQSSAIKTSPTPSSTSKNYTVATNSRIYNWPNIRSDFNQTYLSDSVREHKSFADRFLSFLQRAMKFSRADEEESRSNKFFRKHKAALKEISIGDKSFLIQSCNFNDSKSKNSERTINSDIPSLISCETTSGTWRNYVDMRREENAHHTDKRLETVDEMRERRNMGMQSKMKQEAYQRTHRDESVGSDSNDECEQQHHEDVDHSSNAILPSSMMQYDLKRKNIELQRNLEELREYRERHADEEENSLQKFREKLQQERALMERRRFGVPMRNASVDEDRVPIKDFEDIATSTLDISTTNQLVSFSQLCDGTSLEMISNSHYALKKSVSSSMSIEDDAYYDNDNPFGSRVTENIYTAFELEKLSNDHSSFRQTEKEYILTIHDYNEMQNDSSNKQQQVQATSTSTSTTKERKIIMYTRKKTANVKKPILIKRARLLDVEGNDDVRDVDEDADDNDHHVFQMRHKHRTAVINLDENLTPRCNASRHKLFDVETHSNYMTIIKSASVNDKTLTEMNSTTSTTTTTTTTTGNKNCNKHAPIIYYLVPKEEAKRNS